MRQADEACDDGNQINADGCSARCSLEPGHTSFCGDNIITEGEDCESSLLPVDTNLTCKNCHIGLKSSFSSSSQTMGLFIVASASSKGSLVWIPREQHLVAAASVCGNGVLEPPEECDDSNRHAGDGCSDACLLEIGICGDGKVESMLGEQCEVGTFDHGLPYDCVNCRFVSRSCGNGKMDPGEECDNGGMNSTSPNALCRPDCSLARCGDGVRDTGEDCDDGNRRNGDGCDMQCGNETNVLAEQVQSIASQPSVNIQPATQQPVNRQFTIPFPFQQQYQQMPQMLPYAQLQPLLQQAPQTTQSGPAAVAAIGAGAAAGFSWVRRRKR